METRCAGNPSLALQTDTARRRDRSNTKQKMPEHSLKKWVWFQSSLARSRCLKRVSRGRGERLPTHVGTEVAAFGHQLIWRRREEAFVSAYIQLVKDDQHFCGNVPHFLALSLDHRINVFCFSILSFLILSQFRFCKSAAVARFAWISFLSGLHCSAGGEQLGLL